jgi:hypothetical protein
MKRVKEIVSVVYDKVYFAEARRVSRIITPNDPRWTRAARNRSGSFFNEHVVIVPSASTIVISSTYH